MSKFNQEKFDEFVLNNKVIGFFEKPLKLKSGRMSHWYANWRTVASNAHLLNQLAEYVVDFADDQSLECDMFYGVPEGATPIGIAAQLHYAKKDLNQQRNYPLAMGRANPKEHGHPKDRYFIGNLEGKVIVIEDVTTTGGSLIKTLDQLDKVASEMDNDSLKIVAAIGLTNRQDALIDGKTVKELIEQRDVPYFNLSTGPQLLPRAYQNSDMEVYVGRFIEEEFAKVGVKLNLFE